MEVERTYESIDDYIIGAFERYAEIQNYVGGFTAVQREMIFLAISSAMANEYNNNSEEFKNYIMSKLKTIHMKR